MNLSQTSQAFRIIVNISIALVVIYTLGKLSMPLLRSGYDSIFPPKDPPTVKYGQLEPLAFVEKNISGSPLVKLNTASGGLPTDIPNKLPVFPVRKPEFSYQAAKNAQEDADKLGFTEDELVTNLKNDVFEWKDRETEAELSINIITKELTLKGDVISNLPSGRISRTSANSDAKEMFRSINRLDNTQYLREEGVVTFGRVKNNKIEKVTNQFEAQLARVDFFRKVQDYNVVGPDPTEGLINVLVTASNSERASVKTPQINYHQWSLVEDATGTYPIIPVNIAWDAIAKKGQGVIVNVTPAEESIFSTVRTIRVDEILINNIYIAYYDTPERQDYLQPIYVFEGNYNARNSKGGDITLYYPAITGDWIKQGETN